VLRAQNKLLTKQVNDYNTVISKNAIPQITTTKPPKPPGDLQDVVSMVGSLDAEQREIVANMVRQFNPDN
jgi:hypothetical protein